MIQGIDISSYQTSIDWRKLPNDIEFVLIKASEHRIDPSFPLHWLGAREGGYIRGAYHFFHPTLDPVSQAGFFARVVGPLQNDDLPCIMDWETTDGVPNNEDVERGIVFLTEIRRATGKTPIIYGSPYFLTALALNSVFKQYPLWVAHYGVKKPLVPHPWENWAFWQQSQSAQISGIHGLVDLNTYNGTHDQLLKLARGY